jgi:predicted enzyme related to lactoylglutathione lyase
MMQIVWAAVFADVADAEFDAAVAYWAAVTGGTPAAPTGEHEQFQPLVRPDEDPYVYLQRTEREPGEAGWHFDLFVDQLEPAIDEATRLGARVSYRGGHYVAMATPRGQAFCLVQGRDHQRQPGYARAPQPVAWPDGHQSLLDQVCFDIPPADFDDEAQFWTELTDWERRASDHREFGRLIRPAGHPVRILLQRMDEPEPIRAHVDFSCDDVRAEVGRHEALGGEVVRRTEGWTTLRDPVGLTYCVTRRVPGR